MRKILLSLVILFAFAFLIACGGGETAETPTDEPAAPAASAKTVDPATAGNINGKVSYAGEVSRLARLRMNADPSCEEQHSSPVYAQDLLVNEGALQNAFVWVKDGLGEYQFQTPSGAVELDQKGCIYVPHVLGIQTGQELRILNSDPTTHNINPSPQNNRNWNESQGPKGEPKLKTFARQEIMIPVKCNVHPWMKAYIGVVDHPHYAVTGSDGSFSLAGLPPGEYTVEAWHEKLGTMEQKITLAANETKEVEFAFGG